MMPETFDALPQTVTFVVTIGDDTLHFEISTEALAGDKPDIEAILRAMIAQMPETEEWRAEQVRKWIPDWEYTE